MRKLELRYGIYMPVLLIGTLLICGLRTAGLLTAFDPISGFYNNLILHYISSYLTLGLLVFLCTYPIVYRFKTRLTPAFTSPITYVPTMLVGAALVFLGCTVLNTYFLRYSHTMTPGSITMLLVGVFALLSAIHFALNALIAENKTDLRANFGMCTVIFTCLYAAYLYFSTALPLNNPNKIVDQCAYLFMAMFFLYETRISLGREKWRGYTVFGFMAVAMGFYSAIPTLIMYLVRGTVISNSIAEIALTLTLTIFVLMRLILLAHYKNDENSHVMEGFVAIATERDIEMMEKTDALTEYENMPKPEKDLNQITLIPDNVEDISAAELLEGEIILPSGFSIETQNGEDK